jgi:tetratricopeptide (TPR) repeat protein
LVCREFCLNNSLVRRERQGGFHDGTFLYLGSLEIPDRDIRFLQTSGRELHVGWDDRQQGPQVASMIVDADIRPVVDAIHFGLSRRVADEQRQRLAAEGRGAEYRTAECRYCHAQILARDLPPWSPQVYCPWCDCLNTNDARLETPVTEKDYRICPECGLYSRPRRFTVAYFWFLVFHAGVHHEVVECCGDCMRPRAWKMLFGNAFGVLGLPLTVTQLFRVYRDSARRGPFYRLNRANRLLKQGRIEQALDYYWQMVEGHPASAGILYNVALGLIARGDLTYARQTLELALEHCSNYRPAMQLLESLNEPSQPATAALFGD